MSHSPAVATLSEHLHLLFPQATSYQFITDTDRGDLLAVDIDGGPTNAPRHATWDALWCTWNDGSWRPAPVLARRLEALGWTAESTSESAIDDDAGTITVRAPHLDDPADVHHLWHLARSAFHGADPHTRGGHHPLPAPHDSGADSNPSRSTPEPARLLDGLSPVPTPDARDIDGEVVPCAYCRRMTPPTKQAVSPWNWPGRGLVTNCHDCAGIVTCGNCGTTYDGAERRANDGDPCLDCDQD